MNLAQVAAYTLSTGDSILLPDGDAGPVAARITRLHRGPGVAEFDCEADGHAEPMHLRVAPLDTVTQVTAA